MIAFPVMGVVVSSRCCFVFRVIIFPGVFLVRRSNPFCLEHAKTKDEAIATVATFTSSAITVCDSFLQPIDLSASDDIISYLHREKEKVPAVRRSTFVKESHDVVIPEN